MHAKVKGQRTTRGVTKVVAALGALAITLGACGGDDDDDASSPAPDATVASDAPAASGAPASGEPFLIGINADTTGPGAPYSVPAFETVKSTIELVNEQGGVLGRPLELIQGNDESDATKTPAVLAQLKDRGAIFLLSQQGVSTPKTLIEETGLPFMTVTGISPLHALPPENTYGFAIANPLSQWGPVFCESFAAVGVKDVAILAEDTVTIKSLNGILLEAMAGCVNIVMQEVAPLASSDLTAPVTRIKDKGVDAVWVTSSGGPFEVLAFNTLAQILPDTPKFSLASIANEPEIWDLANPGAMEGLVGLGSLDDNNPQTQKLREILREDRGDDFVATAFDAQAYDAVMIIKRALETANGDTSPQALVAALEQMDSYPASFGAPGYTLSFAPDKHTAFTGECGSVMVQFDEDNEPSAWDEYQPTCD
jgi:branched-chain amino acid transport system substrate-binding protein